MSIRSEQSSRSLPVVRQSQTRCSSISIPRHRPQPLLFNIPPYHNLRKSFSKFLIAPQLYVFSGIVVSVFITLITALIVTSSIAPTVTETSILARTLHGHSSRFTSAKLHSSIADAANGPQLDNTLMHFFDVPPSLSHKIPIAIRYQLLTALQNSRNPVSLHPSRLFVLHVIGDEPSGRLAAVATAMAYAKHTNRILLILWDVARGGEYMGSHPLVPLHHSDNHNVIFATVNNLRLTPNLTHWSELQINYYTSNQTGRYPLDNVAALQHRHVFYRANSEIEGRYSAFSTAISLLSNHFRPSSKLSKAWQDFIRDWLFPSLDSDELSRVLNRVYGVPLIFLEGINDHSRRKLLRALSRSLSKRALFVHAQYGMGNRLRALGSAMAVAKVTGRVLVLIWEPDVHLDCRFSDLFVNDFVVIDKLNMNWPPGEGNPKDTAMRLVDFYNFMRFNGQHIHNPLTELVNPRSGRHVYVKTAYVVRSSFTPRIVSTHSKYWQLMRNKLVPQAEIMYLVNDAAFFNIRRMVGVHIRSRTIENDIKGVSEEFYGKSSQTTDHWRRLTGLATFEAKIKRLSSRYKFFVAADSRNAIDALEQKFGPHRIISLPRDRDCITRDVECAKLALADIILLSKVPTLLGSHWSSFTEAAVRLSGRVKVLLAGVHFGQKKCNNAVPDYYYRQ